MALKLETNNEMLKAFATSDFYQLLAHSIQFPTIELAEAMIDGRYMEDGLSILSELSNDEKDFSTVFDYLSNIVETTNESNHLLSKMRCEYTRLFNDPKSSSLSIYETTFLTGGSNSEEVLFVSPIALNVEKKYRDAGITLVNQSIEPADYLGTELEFMMYLYSKKGQAIHEQDEQLHQTIVGYIEDFEGRHIKKWVCDFFEKLEEFSPNTPYFSVAQFAQTGLKHIFKSI